MTPKTSDDVARAIERAQRTAGWNNRRADVQRFTLPNAYGREPCTLYVVPARRWAFRRWQRIANERRHGGGAA